MNLSMMKEREPWVAWRVGEDEARVQVNRPDLARAFAKVKTVSLAGYSVCGNFMKLFHVKESVPWVDAWMKKCIHDMSVKIELN